MNANRPFRLIKAYTLKLIQNLKIYIKMKIIIQIYKAYETLYMKTNY
jgi:hypothetical protein